MNRGFDGELSEDEEFGLTDSEQLKLFNQFTLGQLKNGVDYLTREKEYVAISRFSSYSNHEVDFRCSSYYT